MEGEGKEGEGFLRGRREWEAFFEGEKRGRKNIDFFGGRGEGRRGSFEGKGGKRGLEGKGKEGEGF